jgi:excisionase family DNA binding protein
VTQREAARLLGVTGRTVRNLLRRGQLAEVRWSDRRSLIEKSSVERLLSERDAGQG